MFSCCKSRSKTCCGNRFVLDYVVTKCGYYDYIVGLFAFGAVADFFAVLRACRFFRDEIIAENMLVFFCLAGIVTRRKDARKRERRNCNNH